MRLPPLIRFVVFAAVAAPAALAGQQPPSREVVWPLPPDTPRIRLVGTFASNADVGKPEPSFLRRVWNAILARQVEQLWIERPFDVYGTAQGRVYATNGLLPQLWLFDPVAHEVRILEPGGEGRLRRPMGLGGDRQGRVYVADPAARRVVVLDTAGAYERAIGGESVFLNPVDVAVAPSGDRVYVVDAHLHQLLVFDAEGKLLRRVGKHEGDLAAKIEELRLQRLGQVETKTPSDVVENRGQGEGEFRFPSFVAVGPQGNVYVTDAINARIQVFTPEGEFIRSIGQLGDGPGTFARPKGVGVDARGRIFVADAAFNNIQIFDSEGRLLLFFGELGSGDGRFWFPSGVDVADNGWILVADRLNSRIQVLEYVGPDVESDPAGEGIDRHPGSQEERR